MVQLSHPCMATGKTIALTIQTCVGKVTSLLFNMLSRLVMGFFASYPKALPIVRLQKYLPLCGPGSLLVLVRLRSVVSIKCQPARSSFDCGRSVACREPSPFLLQFTYRVGSVSPEHSDSVHMCTHVLLRHVFCHGLSQDVEHGVLCCVVVSCISALCTRVCLC